MKRIFIVIAAALAISSSAASADTLLDEIAATPGKAGGVYYAYPTESSQNTPAPKGYRPFYISHYGRHGSRYLISDNDYRTVMERFRRADSLGVLTPLGHDVRLRLDSIWLEARGRGGELSPLGNRQHRAIARRMGEAFPEVFAGNPRVSASSTTVMRCAHSMFAFIEGLQQLFPGLEVPRESGERNMYFLNYHSPESGFYTSHEGPYYQTFKRFKAEKTNPDRLVASLFSDPDYVDMWIDPVELMWQLYWVTVDMQNMETKITFDDIFTPEELYDLWQVFNFEFFARNSSYLPAEGRFTGNARNLVNDILVNANEYIASGENGATLRFGHDGNIIPLVALLKLDGCYTDVYDPHELAGAWNDFRICPMGANLQIVFFKNKAGDILVKFMLNEREIALPIATDSFPFYRWEDLRPYLQDIVAAD